MNCHRVATHSLLFLLVVVISFGAGCAAPLLQTSCQFQDTTGDGILEAEESGELRVTIANEGSVKAKEVEVQISESEESELSLSEGQEIGEILPNETRIAKFSIVAPHNMKDGIATVDIRTIIRGKKGSEPLQQTIKLQGHRPLLKVSHVLQEITEKDGILKAEETATFVVEVTNEGKGIAEDVNIRISGISNKDVSLPEEQSIGDILPGQKKDVQFPIQAAGEIEDKEVVLDIHLTEGQGHNPETSQYTLKLQAHRPLLKSVCQIQETHEDGILEADETATLLVAITNEGKGIAKDVSVHISGIEDTGVSLPAKKYVGDILARHTEKIEFPIIVDNTIEDKELILNLNVIEGRGYSLESLQQTVMLQGHRASLQADVHVEDDNNDQILELHENAILVVIVSNRGKGTAENVALRIDGFEKTGISLPDTAQLGDILPQQTTTAKLPITVSSSIKDNQLPINIQIYEGNMDDSNIFSYALKISREDILYLSTEGSIEACQQYLTTFQEGKYVLEVKDRLEVFLWEHAKALNTIDAYGEYLALYSEGKYSDTAGEAIWEQTKRIDTIKGYLTYLTSYSDTGEHANDANKRIEILEWKHVEDEYSKDSYEAYAKDNSHNNKYVELANQRIKEIEAFESADLTDTYDAYQQFIEEWPESQNVSKVKRKMTAQYWREMLAHEKNAHNYCQLARTLIEEKGQLGYKEAETCYRQALQLDDNYEQAYIGLGKIWSEKGKYNDIIELLTLTPQKFENCILFYYLAKSYENSFDNERAIENYSKAIQCNRTCQQCFYDRGYLRQRENDFKNARNDFEEVIKIDPFNILAEDARRYLGNQGK